MTATSKPASDQLRMGTVELWLLLALSLVWAGSFVMGVFILGERIAGRQITGAVIIGLALLVIDGRLFKSFGRL